MSKYEEVVAAILKKSKINFVKEKTFSDLKHGLFRFDFYILNLWGAPAIVEVDGEQHFISKDWREPLEEIQYRDAIKNQWCKDSGIPLIRIPYTKLSTLTIDDLLLLIE